MSQNNMQVMHARNMRSATLRQRIGAFCGKAGIYLFLLLIA